eukprot:11470629-Alexandrium_andersonii.AAC.1
MRARTIVCKRLCGLDLRTRDLDTSDVGYPMGCTDQGRIPVGIAPGPPHAAPLSWHCPRSARLH